MEQGVGRGRLVVSARGALARVGHAALTTSTVPTFSALEPIAPLKVRKVGKTAVPVGVTLPEFEKGQAFES